MYVLSCCSAELDVLKFQLHEAEQAVEDATDAWVKVWQEAVHLMWGLRTTTVRAPECRV